MTNPSTLRGRRHRARLKAEKGAHVERIAQLDGELARLKATADPGSPRAWAESIADFERALRDAAARYGDSLVVELKYLLGAVLFALGRSELARITKGKDPGSPGAWAATIEHFERALRASISQRAEGNVPSLAAACLSGRGRHGPTVERSPHPLTEEKLWAITQDAVEARARALAEEASVAAGGQPVGGTTSIPGPPE